MVRAGKPSTSSGKATFGFNLTCDENGNLTGDWTYHDKAAGVDVSGFIPAEAEVPCEEGTPGGIVEIPTPYQAQHCKEADPNDCFGVALITVDDSNTGGEPPKGDLLSIQLSGGPFDGYSNVNLVLGGNLVATNTQ
jgi:hypothetical protein